MKILFTLAALICYASSVAQISWEPKADFGGDARMLPTSFVIDGKTYLTCGLRTNQDVATDETWVYDPQTDAWSPEIAFSGEPRWAAFGFTIDDKAYVGGGTVGNYNSNTFSSSVYEYDPTVNLWSQKQGLNFARSQSVGFSIDGKGYVGWGYASASNQDRDETVYEYDPIVGPLGTWTQLTSIPNVVDDVVVLDRPGGVFVLNDEAYVTGGTFPFSETWKFNPDNNGTWINTTNVELNAVGAFKLGNQGYIIGTQNLCYVNGGECWESVVMKYNTSTSSWVKVDDFPSQFSLGPSVMQSSTPCGTGAIIGNSGSGVTYSFEDLDAFPTTGPTFLCTTDQTYTISNVPAGATVSWSVSPTSLFAVDSGTGSTFETRATNSSTSGAGTITATISGDCGNVELDPFDVWVGKPFTTTVNPDPEFCLGDRDSNYILPESPGADTYTLQSNSSYLDVYPTNPTAGQLINFIASQAGNYTVTLSTTNTCGTSSGTIFVTVESCGGGGGRTFTAYPNPAFSTLTIEETTNPSNWNGVGLSGYRNDAMYVLYNSKSEEVSSGTLLILTTLDVSAYKKGRYVLKIYEGQEIESHHIVLE